MKNHFVKGAAFGCSAMLIGLLLGSGCAYFSKVTPEVRASAYESHARASAVACKAYKFDRATGLTLDVPAMNALCK